MTLACGLCFSHKTRPPLRKRLGSGRNEARTTRARSSLPARAERRHRASTPRAIRTTFEHFFFFFSAHVLVQYVRGDIAYGMGGARRLTEHVSHDEPASNEKNPKKPEKNPSTKTHQVRNGATLGLAADIWPDEGCRGMMNAANPAATVGAVDAAPSPATSFSGASRDAPVSSRGAHRGCGAAGVPDRRRRDPRCTPSWRCSRGSGLLGGARAGKRAEAEETRRRTKRATARRRRRRPTRDRGFTSRRRRRPRPRPRRVRAPRCGAARAARARFREAAARALAPLIRAQDVARALASPAATPPLSATTGRLRFRRLRGRRESPRALGVPARRYNAAHGALLCAAELLGAEGPAEAGLAAHAMAAAETAAEGLSWFIGGPGCVVEPPPPPRALERARDAAIWRVSARTRLERTSKHRKHWEKQFDFGRDVRDVVLSLRRVV